MAEVSVHTIKVCLFSFIIVLRNSYHIGIFKAINKKICYDNNVLVMRVSDCADNNEIVMISPKI